MRKKILVILSVFLISASAVAQSVINRTFGTNTVNDPRLMASTNFYMPKYLDTTSANILKGIDTCGAQIFTYVGNAIWYRACNPKRWVKVLNTGDVPPVFWGDISGSISDQLDLLNLFNTKLNIQDTVNAWWPKSKRFVDTVYRVNDSTVGYTILGVPRTFEIKGGASGGGGTAAIWGNITGTLSNQSDLQSALNLKLNISDTSSMLSGYLRKVDTASMLFGYLRKVDTAAMLNNYVVGAGYGLIKNNKFFRVDTFAITTNARLIKVADSVSGVSTVNLDTSRTSTTATIIASGTDAVLPLVNIPADKAGLMSPTDKGRLDSLYEGLINGDTLRIRRSNDSVYACLKPPGGAETCTFQFIDSTGLTGVTNASTGVIDIISKVGKNVKGVGVIQGDGITLFNRGDTALEIAAPLAQDYSPYRFPPEFRWVLNPTLTDEGRPAYTLVKVDPWPANNSYMPGTNDTLIITTPDGNPNVAHPSMVYIDSGWHGFKYWLAFTPYPPENREDPCILASNDGWIWVVPPGTTNPVEPPPSPGDFHSDVELVFRDDESTMYLFWRFETVAGVSSQYYRKCSDGANWVNKTQFLSSGAGASPTLVFKDSVWHMWEVDYTTNFTTQDPFYVIYRTSPSLAGFELAKKYRCVINNTPAGKHVWHIEVRWNRAEDQFCGIFNYTTINPGGAPNNGGVLAYVTSTSTTTWDVRTPVFPLPENEYRSTLDSSRRANQNGARFEAIYNPQWKFKPVYLWIAPRATAPVFTNYDTVPLQSIYGLKYRRTSHWGFPVAEVRRSSDDSTIHVFPGANNVGLIIRPLTVAKKDGDTTALSVWAGSDSIYLVRLYNQVDTTGDYLTFTEPGQPYIDSAIWNGTGAWGWIDDGVDDFGQSYKSMQFNAVITASSLDTGKLFSRSNGTPYFGYNGTNLTALWNTNISTAGIPSPQVRTGIYGAAASIRVNGVQQVTGTTTVPSALGQYKVGVYFNGTTSQDFHKGRFAELVTFNSTPSAGALAHVEGIMMSEYAYDQDSVLFDNFTDANGTAITSHTPTLAPGGSSWAASDGNFQIQSNALTRSAAGSDNQIAAINSGISNGYFSGTYTPGVSGGSGIVFRHTNATNFYYVRVFSGTTLGLFKMEAGVETLVQSAAVTAPGTWSVVVECWGSRIRVFLNGATTPQITVTNTFNMTATGVGVWARSADFPQVWDNIKATPFINLAP